MLLWTHRRQPWRGQLESGRGSDVHDRTGTVPVEHRSCEHPRAANRGVQVRLDRVFPFVITHLEGALAHACATADDVHADVEAVPAIECGSDHALDVVDMTDIALNGDGVGALVTGTRAACFRRSSVGVDSDNTGADLTEHANGGWPMFPPPPVTTATFPWRPSTSIGKALYLDPTSPAGASSVHTARSQRFHFA